jgi:small subunit ribosomal protein S13
MADDFKHIVRIAATNLDGNKRVEFALMQITGVGKKISTLLTDYVGLDRTVKIGNLSEKEIASLDNALSTMDTWAPAWILNRQKDYYTGKNKHLIGPELELTVREDINLLRKIRSYRGIRHEKGLPVRGQRTRSNKRMGLAVGVSRKKVKKGK